LGSTIALGNMKDVSASNAATDTIAVQGEKLKIAQLNAAGGIDGHQITVDYEDTHGDPAQAASIAQKFVTNQVVAVLGTDSGLSAAGAPILEKAGIPYISPEASNPALTQGGAKYFFRTVNTEAQLDPTFAQFLATNLKAQKIATIVGQEPDEQASVALTVNTIKQQFSSIGIVDAEVVPANDTDFRSVITKLHALNPDVIYAGLFSQQGAPLVAQVRQSGWSDVRIVGASSSFFTNDFIKIAGSAAEGTYTFSFFLPDEPGSNVSTFVSAFKAQYNSAPDQWAAAGYDEVTLITNAIATALQSGCPTADAIRTAMLGASVYHGLTGDKKYLANGDIAPAPELPVVVKAGAWSAAP
jgi:branched-chain amino acid transport system substrate-binding protein